MKKVRKAVFPVAGMGTRFLPATKASPKEMLPIVDKPLIQFAVEEAVAAGITDMVFVTGRSKRSESTVSSSPPKSSPKLTGLPLALRSASASWNNGAASSRLPCW